MANDSSDRSPFQREEVEALDELAAPPPEQNIDDANLYRHHDLEDQTRRSAGDGGEKQTQPASKQHTWSSMLATVYTSSYLIFFSIFGTLARLGVVALTRYPGAPVASTVLWANVGGSTLMGFLREDRTLFRKHYRKALKDAQQNSDQPESADSADDKGNDGQVKETAVKAFNTKKSSLKVFIGLTVGFCGSFTSFSEILLDAFLAISNNLDTAAVSSLQTIDVQQKRQPGYSVMAVIGVLWLHTGMSMTALFFGASLARAFEAIATWIPELEQDLGTHTVDLIMVFLGWGTWLGAVFMSIWPPYDSWRGQALFALVSAPLGCLLRFFLALELNRRIPSFPLGTFAANVLGTCILGMCYDLQHTYVGSTLVASQVLQGIQDGFCGALTTVSTWVLEMKSLRVRHAYSYGAISLGVSLVCIVAIMAPVRWIYGFNPTSL